MRSGIIILLLCAGTAAFGQSNAAAPLSSYKLELTQPAFAQSAGDSAKPRVDLHPANNQLWKAFTISGPRQLQRKDSAQVDPGMIVRPPTSSIGVQPSGTPIAQNLYPGLQLLPIEEAKAKQAPNPAEQPDLNLQETPIKWPRFELWLVNGGSAKPAE